MQVKTISNSQYVIARARFPKQSPSLREETASREALRSDMFKLRIAEKS